MLREVEPLLRRELPAGHYAFASLALERAFLAQATGDLPTALRLVNEAFAITDAAVKAGGQGAHLFKALFSTRSNIELDLGEIDKAAADARQGLKLSQTSTEPGTFTPFLGQAYGALARALEAQGNHEEARAAFRSAAEQVPAAAFQLDHGLLRVSEVSKAETAHRQRQDLFHEVLPPDPHASKTC